MSNVDHFALGQRDRAIRDANAWQRYAKDLAAKYDRANTRVAGYKGVIESFIKALRDIAPDHPLLDRATRDKCFDETIKVWLAKQGLQPITKAELDKL